MFHQGMSRSARTGKQVDFSTTTPNAIAAQDRYGSAPHAARPDPHGRKEPVLKKPAKNCLVLHKKSCTRREVKAAVKHVRQSGIDIDVYIPWSRKDLRRFVRQAIEEQPLHEDFEASDVEFETEFALIKRDGDGIALSI